MTSFQKFAVPTLKTTGQGSGADSAVTLPYTANQSEALVRFRVLRWHADGGLGRVHVAQDTELGREVALKEIKVEWADDVDSRERFTREAEITGNLEHPGIVPVYGRGTYPDGRPYYAMRFIRGMSLKEAIERHHGRFQSSRDGLDRYAARADQRRLLKRLIDVCQAMQYAHIRGVVHRDLKPGNIMLGQYGETLVVDWGLAKATGQPSVRLAAESNQAISNAKLPDTAIIPRSPSSAPTQLGQFMGTPQYMSPEQAQGRVDLVGPESDLFSLGAILYEILTGQSPYRASSSRDLLRLASEADYVPPRKLAPQIPRPLEAICLKAMDPVIPQRYTSAAQLAQDLDNYLADEPVSAYRLTWFEKTARWLRRNKSKAVAIAISLFAVLAASILISGLSIRYGQSLQRVNNQLAAARDDAEGERDKALKAQAETERQNKELQKYKDFMFGLRDKENLTVGEAIQQYIEQRAQRLEQGRTP